MEKELTVMLGGSEAKIKALEKMQNNLKNDGRKDRVPKVLFLTKKGKVSCAVLLIVTMLLVAGLLVTGYVLCSRIASEPIYEMNLSYGYWGKASYWFFNLFIGVGLIFVGFLSLNCISLIGEQLKIVNVKEMQEDVLALLDMSKKLNERIKAELSEGKNVEQSTYEKLSKECEGVSKKFLKSFGKMASWQ